MEPASLGAESTLVPGSDSMFAVSRLEPCPYRYVQRHNKTEMCALSSRGHCPRQNCSFAHSYEQLLLRPSEDRDHLGALRMITYWVVRHYDKKFFLNFYGPHPARCCHCGKLFDIGLSGEYPVCGDACSLSMRTKLLQQPFREDYDLFDCRMLRPATATDHAWVEYVPSMCPYAAM